MVEMKHVSLNENIRADAICDVCSARPSVSVLIREGKKCWPANTNAYALSKFAIRLERREITSLLLKK